MEDTILQQTKTKYVAYHPERGYIQKGGTYTTDINRALLYTHLGRWSEYLASGINEEDHVVLEVEFKTTCEVIKQCNTQDAIESFKARYEYLKTWDPSIETKDPSVVWRSFLELRNKMISLGLIRSRDFPLSRVVENEC